jgi:hypothetical protein
VLPGGWVWVSSQGFLLVVRPAKIEF